MSKSNRQLIKILRDAETSFYRDGISVAGAPRVLVRVEVKRTKGERVYFLSVDSPGQSGYLVSLNVTTREVWTRPYDRIKFPAGATSWGRSESAYDGTLGAYDAAAYRTWNSVQALRDEAIEAGYAAV